MPSPLVLESANSPVFGWIQKISILAAALLKMETFRLLALPSLRRFGAADTNKEEEDDARINSNRQIPTLSLQFPRDFISKLRWNVRISVGLIPPSRLSGQNLTHHKTQSSHGKWNPTSDTSCCKFRTFFSSHTFFAVDNIHGTISLFSSASRSSGDFPTCRSPKLPCFPILIRCVGYGRYL